ncbi:quaternary amine ABC transporter ATP-binding protein [Sediminivirga luteola]|uniref:quaternary amine ABC transporter ATP-binding protein n=1 Tax=Sediminivirga luteola TaxID=1774748 RepID=UPI001F59D7C5|nr:glycine betaine/L-proline ABC transporter ATP-binding protein [Sediminivirga luteola]
MSHIEASHVYKVFGKREQEVVKRLEAGADRKDLTQLGTAAVIDASFSVEPGEIFVVMGLSGSGKSTLIRTINGLWKPTTGSIKIMGSDIAKMDARTLRATRRDKISMVFQHFALLPHRTVRENAAYGLEMQKVPKAERMERADTWLDTVGLGGWGDKYPHQLSGGMRQRVGLARALAAETDILLMDEAFSALDPLIRREMQEQLIELQETLSKTIVFITHDLNEAMFLGDRIAVMRDGRIVQIGTSEEILTEPANDYVAQFVQDVDRTRVLTAGSVMERPDAVVQSNVGPRVALHTMQEQKVAALLVTDRHRKLLGLVRDRQVVRAAREGQKSITPLIETKDVLRVNENDPLSSLFAPASSSIVPLAVTDDKERLLGVIPRVALLQTMASIGPDTGEIPVIDDSGELHAGEKVNGDHGAGQAQASPQDLAAEALPQDDLGVDESLTGPAPGPEDDAASDATATERKEDGL